MSNRVFRRGSFSDLRQLLLASGSNSPIITPPVTDHDLASGLVYKNLSALPALSNFPSSPFQPPIDPVLSIDLVLYRIPGATWAIEPTAEERNEIERLDALVNEAEQFYHSHAGKKFPFRGCEEPISPLQYMDFLAHVYTSYEKRNAFVDINRAYEFECHSPVKDYPKLQSSPLAVMAYGMRSKKDGREFGLPGDFCGYDHTPGTFVLKRAIIENKLPVPADLVDKTTTRSIPKKLHTKFHQEITDLPLDPYEAAQMQMGWYHDRLGELGYSEHAVNASEAHVHEMNQHLGIYDEAGKIGLKNPSALIHNPQSWGQLMSNASRGRQPSQPGDPQRGAHSRS